MRGCRSIRRAGGRLDLGRGVARFLHGDAWSMPTPLAVVAPQEPAMSPNEPPPSSLDAFAHDVRSALTVVRAHAQLLGRRARSENGVDREQLIERAGHIDAAAGRAILAVADFVDRHRAGGDSA